MTKLKNERHEIFCRHRAKGVHYLEAYVKAGFKAHKGAAYRLGQRDDVKQRIRELAPIEIVVPPPVELVPTSANPGTLAELGYSRKYFAECYRRIAAAAEEQGQLNHAVTALAKIQNMYESEVAEKGEGTPKRDAQRIDINALGAVLDKVAGVIAASKAPDRSTADAVTYKAIKASENET